MTSMNINDKIKVLCFNDFSSKGFGVITIFNAFKHVKTLILYGVVAEQINSQFVEFISTNKNLEALIVQADDLTKIFKALSTNSSVTTLTFKAFITEEMAFAFKEMLENNKTLTALQCLPLHFANNSLSTVCQAWAQNNNIKTTIFGV